MNREELTKYLVEKYNEIDNARVMIKEALAEFKTENYDFIPEAYEIDRALQIFLEGDEKSLHKIIATIEELDEDVIDNCSDDLKDELTEYKILRGAK